MKGVAGDGEFEIRKATNGQYYWVFLIVALSRTRKQCHLVFCRRYAGVAKQPSEFFHWIDQEWELRDINAAYWKEH